MFICEFCKIFKKIFWQNTSRWLLYVLICEFWEFLDRLFYRAPLGNCLFQVAEFQMHHTVKEYFASAFQAFYTRRSSCSKAFMYLNSLKIICEEIKL